MMTNIFSVFDPSSTWVTNWVSVAAMFLMTPASVWVLKGKTSLPWVMTSKKLHSEFSLLLSPSSPKGVTPLVVAMFMFIMLTNLLGLTPYTFTASSHMSVTLAMSLPTWLGLMLFGWLNSPSHMLAHLIPQSTPPVLMPFMVLIETTSNIIRPATLAIRLTANMMAGHLLMTLLGSQVAANGSYLTQPIMVATPMILLTLEMAVAMIQAYVFSVLITLYVSEVSYDS